VAWASGVNRMLEAPCGEDVCIIICWPVVLISSSESAVEPSGRCRVPMGTSNRRFIGIVGAGGGPVDSPRFRLSSAILAISSKSDLPESTWRW
jgi:hypothetical protein